VRSGSLDAARLDGVFGLWPLILVGIGLSLLLADTRAAILGGLLVAVTFGTMAGAVLAGVSVAGFSQTTGVCGFGSSDGGQAFEARQGSFTGDAQVQLRMNCGDVRASTTPGTGWSVSGTAGAGLEPTVEQGDRRLVVSTPARSGTFGRAAARWNVGLPDGVGMDLELDVDAGSAELALDRSQVTRLDIGVNAGSARVGLREDAELRSINASVNAGSATFDLPAASFQGKITVNAGSAEVCMPTGTGVRIRAGDVTLGSTNLASRGLVQQGSTWTTPGYADAPVQVELEITVNVGSFTLDPENGCG
jgi:hypothetical protein